MDEAEEEEDPGGGSLALRRRPPPQLCSHLRVVTLNDLLSHCDAYEALARSARLGDEHDFADSHPVLALDAGSWCGVGTVYACLTRHPSAPEIRPELEFMKEYHVYATLGDRDFDAGLEGLLNVLDKAEDLGLFGRLVASNLVVDGAKSSAAARLMGLYSRDPREINVLNESLVVDIPGFGRVGLVGLMGSAARRAVEGRLRGRGVGFASWGPSVRKARALLDGMVGKTRLNIVMIHGEERLPSDLTARVDLILNARAGRPYAADEADRRTRASGRGESFGEHLLQARASPREGKSAPSKKKPARSSKLVFSGVLPVIPLPDPDRTHPDFGLLVLPTAARCFPAQLGELAAELPLPPTRTGEWVCEAAARELSSHVSGFILPEEMIRGGEFFDAREARAASRWTTAELIEWLERGAASPERLGGDVIVLETTPGRLRLLRAWLEWRKFFAASTVVCFASSSAREHTWKQVVRGRKLRVGTSLLALDLLRAAGVPQWVLGKRVQVIHASLALMVRDFLKRESPSDPETLALA